MKEATAYGPSVHLLTTAFQETASHLLPGLQQSSRNLTWHASCSAMNLFFNRAMAMRQDEQIFTRVEPGNEVQ